MTQGNKHMAIDLIHDSKSALSELTDRSPDDGSAAGALPASDDSGNSQQTGLASSLGSDDGAATLSYHSGLERPVTVSFLPPPANPAPSDAGLTTPPTGATVTEEFFGNFAPRRPFRLAVASSISRRTERTAAVWPVAVRRSAAARRPHPGARRIRPE
jgi:hypothetical protein